MANLIKFLKRDSFDKVWFGYVTGIRVFLPSISVERCYHSFCKYYEIDKKEFKLDNAAKIYQRMNEELRSLNKNC